tara:strand:- start:165 stop:1013 length:849 start_codon:yes stop_codon:yes gene_type:complete
MKNLYLSSMVFGSQDLSLTVNECEKNKWNLEFSSGIPFVLEAKKIFYESKIQKLAHNYFPAPRIPFVLNLGSSNNEIRKKSILHCMAGLDLTKKTNGNFFSAHSGFCIDPLENMLGRKFIHNIKIDRELNKNLFINSLEEINDYALKTDTLFLIENNVLTTDNNNKINPLLCCDSDEIIEILELMNSNNIGLLLDTGHLKVSCHTLKKSLKEEFIKLKSYVNAIHHSDNDSINDLNNMINTDYWFWEHSKDFVEIINIIEVKCNSKNDIRNQINIFLKNGVY